MRQVVEWAAAIAIVSLLIGIPIYTELHVMKTNTEVPAAVVSTDTKTAVTHTHRETIRKPDGEVVTSIDTTSTVISTDSRTEMPTPAVKSKYRLGAGVELYPLDVRPTAITGKYLDIGRRVYDTPIWIDTRINTNRELSLGISVEF